METKKEEHHNPMSCMWQTMADWLATDGQGYISTADEEDEEEG
jgi:hypothetical protein